MNHRPLPTLLLCACWMLGAMHAASGQDRMAAANERLAALRAQAPDPYQGVRGVTQPEAPVEVVKEEESLLSRVVFLTNGRVSVLLPKGAVIHAPAGSRITVSPRLEGSLVEWEEFSIANRADIHLVPVDFDQLQGDAPLDPRELELIHRKGVVALTAYRNQPVALPPAS